MPPTLTGVLYLTGGFFMPYNGQITRGDAEALIPEEVSREIIQELPESSAFLRFARRLPNMSRKEFRMPILNSLITAYWVNGDTGLKQTSELEWANVYLYAEELAVIVPIPENVLADSSYDIWGEVRPRMVEAFGKAIDQAAFLNVNKPATWPVGIVQGATNASHAVTAGAGGADIYDSIMSEGGVIAKVEEDGYAVTGHVAALALRAKLRGLRSATDELPIFKTSMQGSTSYELDGSPINFPVNGSMNAGTALLISGDWNRAVWSMRSDVTYKLLDQAVIQDASGNIIYNLAQQDMVALRAVLRLGWALPNPINPINSNAATRYPFAVLVP
jgi:HK97 family phage major capsid protein